MPFANRFPSIYLVITQSFTASLKGHFVPTLPGQYGSKLRKTTRSASDKPASGGGHQIFIIITAHESLFGGDFRPEWSRFLADL